MTEIDDKLTPNQMRPLVQSISHFHTTRTHTHTSTVIPTPPLVKVYEILVPVILVETV